VDGAERAERVEPLAAALQLAGSLGAAQEEHGDERELGRHEVECLLEEVAVLRHAAARAAGEARPAAPGELVDGGADLRLVVAHDGLAVRGLVAREPQRVQRERIDVGCRPLLLDQAAEDSELNRVGVHGGEVYEPAPASSPVARATTASSSAVAHARTTPPSPPPRRPP
jgi:hypothetical protein